MQRQDSRKFIGSLIGVGLIVGASACTGAVGQTENTVFDPEDPGASEPAVSACGGTPNAGLGRWRRLTSAQYTNTVRDPRRLLDQ